MRFHLLFLVAILPILALSGCGELSPQVPVALVQTTSPTSPVPLVTNTQMPTPTEEVTATETPTPTLTLSPTLSPTATITPTETSTPTLVPTSGPTPDDVVRRVRVPILMYHYISEPPEGAHPYRVGNSLAPDTFAAHLDFLQAEGYRTISLKDMISYLVTGQPALPQKPIILTFDDGYEDNYLNALPALVEHDMMGTFFIITDFANQAETDETYADYANWDQLKAMADAGMEIGSHSRNHPNLAGKDLDYLVWQALGSQEAIEAHVGEHPHILSYPAGSYDQLVIDVFRSAHYWGAVTTEQGVMHSSQGDDPFRLHRVRISNTTGVPQLQALLDYEWPQ